MAPRKVLVILGGKAFKGRENLLEGKEVVSIGRDVLTSLSGQRLADLLQQNELRDASVTILVPPIQYQDGLREKVLPTIESLNQIGRKFVLYVPSYEYLESTNFVGTALDGPADYELEKKNSLLSLGI